MPKLKEPTEKELAELEEYYQQVLDEVNQDYFRNDSIARFKVQLGKRLVGLDYFIDRKEGELKHSFTVKEAAALLQKRPENVQTRVIKKGVRTNRVPREVVLDELADQFKISEDELIERIEWLHKNKPLIKSAPVRKRIAKNSPAPAGELNFVAYAIVGLVLVQLKRRGFIS